MIRVRNMRVGAAGGRLDWMEEEEKKKKRKTKASNVEEPYSTRGSLFLPLVL